MSNKDKILRVRIDDYTDEQLLLLEKRYEISRSEIVRRCISMFQNGTVNKLFGVDILEIFLPFEGAYDVIDHGIVENNYLSGKGFWLNLKANFRIGLAHGFTHGATTIDFKGNSVYVNGGFLNDIQSALAILYSSRVNQ